MPIHEHNMRIVDTALWVMPERYQDGIRENYRYAINLADSDWALACDTVAQAITLEPEAVRWRTERSKRPWFAGTIVEHMCALMDVNMLRYMLHQQAKVRQASASTTSQSPQKSRIPGQVAWPAQINGAVPAVTFFGWQPLVLVCNVPVAHDSLRVLVWGLCGCGD